MITLPKIILSILVAIFVGVGLAAFGIVTRNDPVLFCILAFGLNLIIQLFILRDGNKKHA